VWQRVAVCCSVRSVLQCVTLCCSQVLDAMGHGSVSQCVELCVAVCCSLLLCVAVRLQMPWVTAVCCCILQRVAVCYSVLQCVAVKFQMSWVTADLRQKVTGHVSENTTWP